LILGENEEIDLLGDELRLDDDDVFDGSPNYRIGHVQNFYSCRGKRSLDMDFEFGKCGDFGEGGSRPGRLDEIERELIRIRSSYAGSSYGEGYGTDDFQFDSDDDYDL
jgi:hypothetical protein